MVVNNYKDPKQTEKAVQNIEKCTGQKTSTIDFRDPGLRDIVAEKDPDLVVLTGSSALLSKPETRERFQPEMNLVKESTYPILGICYGHQIIGSAFGSSMRDLGQMQRRYDQVTVVKKHPLFGGLPSTLIVAESHRQEITRVPDDFEHLAQSATSRVEAMVHRTRPIYGVQFHPERSGAEHPHGRVILQNLLKLIE